MCRTILIWRALETPDPGASNGGLNVQIRHFGANLEDFEVARLSRISNICQSIRDENQWFDTISEKRFHTLVGAVSYDINFFLFEKFSQKRIEWAP